MPLAASHRCISRAEWDRVSHGQLDALKSSGRELKPLRGVCDGIFGALHPTATQVAHQPWRLAKQRATLRRIQVDVDRLAVQVGQLGQAEQETRAKARAAPRKPTVLPPIASSGDSAKGQHGVSPQFDAFLAQLKQGGGGGGQPPQQLRREKKRRRREQVVDAAAVSMALAPPLPGPGHRHKHGPGRICEVGRMQRDHERALATGSFDRGNSSFCAVHSAQPNTMISQGKANAHAHRVWLSSLRAGQLAAEAETAEYRQNNRDRHLNSTAGPVRALAPPRAID